MGEMVPTTPSNRQFTMVRLFPLPDDGYNAGLLAFILRILNT